jgi:hypothetical protein
MWPLAAEVAEHAVGRKRRCRDSRAVRQGLLAATGLLMWPAAAVLLTLQVAMYQSVTIGRQPQRGPLGHGFCNVRDYGWRGGVVHHRPLLGTGGGYLFALAARSPSSHGPRGERQRFCLD